MIKVTQENATDIEASLYSVNGKEEQHTMTSSAEVIAAAARGEAALAAAFVMKKMRAGSRYVAYSRNACLPAAYKWKAKGTKLTLVRENKGWYIEKIEPYIIFTGKGKGHADRLIVPDFIAAEAVRQFQMRSFDICAQA